MKVYMWLKNGKTKLELFSGMPELWQIIRDHPKGENIEVLRKKFNSAINPHGLTMDDWAKYSAYIRNKILIEKGKDSISYDYFLERDKKLFDYLNQVPKFEIKPCNLDEEVFIPRGC